MTKLCYSMAMVLCECECNVTFIASMLSVHVDPIMVLFYVGNVSERRELMKRSKSYQSYHVLLLMLLPVQICCRIGPTGKNVSYT